jgi:hypothetical protein
MKKNTWKFAVAALLVAVVAAACVVPFDPPEDPVEYDAQGRRLVTVTVDLGNAARAVNTPIAQAYIDFYEVVFLRLGSPDEYYSATTTKGAGKSLSLRVPALGDYNAYLNAGQLVKGRDNHVVLLAQAEASANNPSGNPISSSWAFDLSAGVLNIKANPGITTHPGSLQSASGHSINVKKEGPAYHTVYTTPDGIPYYKLESGDVGELVTVTVNTGAKNLDSSSLISIVSLGDTSPLGLDDEINKATTAIISGGGTNAVPAFSAGILTFNFVVPAVAASSSDGLSNIGFDVEVVSLMDAPRSNGLKPVKWHIRNGLDVDKLDNGADNVTNIGAGLLFAWGDADPDTAMIPNASIDIGLVGLGL